MKQIRRWWARVPETFKFSLWFLALLAGIILVYSVHPSQW